MCAIPALQNLGSYFVTSWINLLAITVDKTLDNKDWVFEIKWDGVRAIFFFNNQIFTCEVCTYVFNDISTGDKPTCFDDTYQDTP